MKNVILRSIFLLVVIFPTLSSAMQVGNMFVFGDSLSDGGNVYNTVGYPFLPYAERFSNGPVAVEQFASMAGINLQPSTVGGTNFAYGGAATGIVPGTNSIAPATGGVDNYLAASKSLPVLSSLNGTGILNQVNTFAISGTNFDPTNSLFVVWGGANDIFTWLNGNSTASIDQVIGGAVNNIVASIGTLAGLGAQNFLIPNLVDLSITPDGAASAQAQLPQISSLFNGLLGFALEQIANLNILRPDLNNLMQLVLADPASYGIANSTGPCFDGISVCANAGEYLFWDSVHPTERGHSIIAEYFYSLAISEPVPVPEPPTIALIGAIIFIRFSFRVKKH